MPPTLGSFEKGCPTIKVHIGGALPSISPVEFSAIVDTGFSGFIAMPLIQAFPPGVGPIRHIPV